MLDGSRTPCQGNTSPFVARNGDFLADDDEDKEEDGREDGDMSSFPFSLQLENGFESISIKIMRSSNAIREDVMMDPVIMLWYFLGPLLCP